MVIYNGYPPGYRDFLMRAFESDAYYNGYPYPSYALRQWKTETMGNYPTPLPFPKSIIDRGAIWLFGKQTNFSFPHLSNEINEAILEIWRKNKMDSRLVKMAKMGMTEGVVGLKFSIVDKEVIIQILSCKDHVQFFYDPHNCTKLLMARIEYIYMDVTDGKYYIHREEWDDKEVRYYHKVEAQVLDKNFLEIKLDFIKNTEGWKIANTKKHNFGFIPIVHVKNIDDGSDYGSGDLFGQFRIIDRINVTYNLMDRHNQQHVDPAYLFIDLEPKPGDNAPQGVHPGAVIDVQTAANILDDEETESKRVTQGKAQILEPTGLIREHLLNYAKELTQLLFDTTGAVFPRQEQITNKGSLTQSVLIQIYAQLLEVTEEKRKAYGTEGICKFLQIMILSLKNAGVKEFKGVKPDKETDLALTCNFTWFSHFKQTQDELFRAFDRIDREVKGGYIPVKTAIQFISSMEEFSMTEKEIQEQVSKVEENIENEHQQQQQLSGDASQTNDGEPDERKRGNKPKPSKQQGSGSSTVEDAT